MRQLILLSDIEERVGELGEVQALEAQDLIEDATAHIEAFCTKGIPDPVPDRVKLVCRRMVLRALNAGDVPTGLDSVQNAAGPFSQTVQLTSGSTDGGAWLTRADRKLLRRWRHGAFSVPIR